MCSRGRNGLLKKASRDHYPSMNASSEAPTVKAIVALSTGWTSSVASANAFFAAQKVPLRVAVRSTTLDGDFPRSVAYSGALMVAACGTIRWKKTTIPRKRRNSCVVERSGELRIASTLAGNGLVDYETFCLKLAKKNDQPSSNKSSRCCSSFLLATRRSSRVDVGSCRNEEMNPLGIEKLGKCFFYLKGMWIYSLRPNGVIMTVFGTSFTTET